MAVELMQRITSVQVARQLGISAVRVRQFADEGRLPSILTPLGRLYDPLEVEQFQSARLARLRPCQKGEPNGPASA